MFSAHFFSHFFLSKTLNSFLTYSFLIILILFIYSLLTCTLFRLITLFIIFLLTHLVLNTFLIITDLHFFLTDLLATIPILFPFLLAHLTVTCNLAMNLFFIY